MTGLALLLGIAMAGGRHRCTLAAELGFAPVHAGGRSWVALVRPVGWDTQGDCPREPQTVRFTVMPGLDPTDLPEGRLPVFHYQHSEEATPGGTMVLDLWALVGTTRPGGATDGCETTVEVMKVTDGSPPTLLVRPTLPLQALGCPAPGRPLEVVVPNTDPSAPPVRGDTLRIRRSPDSLQWSVQDGPAE